MTTLYEDHVTPILMVILMIDRLGIVLRDFEHNDRSIIYTHYLGGTRLLRSLHLNQQPLQLQLLQSY